MYHPFLAYWSNPEKAKPAYTSATDNNEFKYKSWHENYEEELDSGKVGLPPPPPHTHTHLLSYGLNYA